MNRKLNVLYVDPWGVNGPSFYTNGICYGLDLYVNLTFAGNFYYKNNTDAGYKICRIFFRYSQKMRDHFIRKIVRTIEYVKGWICILSLLGRNNIDIIHINWLLLYQFDFLLLKWLKRRYPKIKIIYTAHNVLPHIHGEKYVNILKKIYDTVDVVILHGEKLCLELETYFPNQAEKTFIQYHGCNINKNTEYILNNIDKNIRCKVESYDKIALFIGSIFTAKGTDRLFEIWIDSKELDDVLLIIAGEESEKNTEYNLLKQEVVDRNNIYVLDYYIDNNTANYLLNQATVLLLPYRHASMSGVIFTATDFGKPVIATNVGAISEYIDNLEGAFLTKNEKRDFQMTLEFVFSSYTREELEILGMVFQRNMTNRFAWDLIAKKLVEECYKQILDREI